MAFNYEYPYTDAQRYNDDWLINKVKELSMDWLKTSGEWTDMQEAWEELKQYITNYFNNLDVQEEINKKLDVMKADGSLFNIIRPLFNEYQQAIDVLSARMDTFTALGDDSTTGDAELADIRVDYTGHTWPTAGDAVRGVAGQLSSEIVNSVKRLYNNGNVANDTVLFTSNDVEIGDIVYYSLSTPNYAGFIALYDENDERISFYGRASTADVETNKSGNMVIPSNFSYAKMGTNGSSVLLNELCVFPREKYIGDIVTIDTNIINNVGLMNGSISNGSYVESEVALVTAEFIDFTNGLTVELPNTWKSIVFCFDTNKAYANTYYGYFDGNHKYENPINYKYAKVVFARVSEEPVTPSELVGVGNIIKNEKLIDTTLFICETLDTMKNIECLIEPKNTNENMGVIIQNALNTYKNVKLGSGVFVVDVASIKIPSGGSLSGCGHNTIIKTNITNGYALNLTDNCKVENLTIKGNGNGTMPTEINGNGGIYANQQSSKNRVINVDFEDLLGNAIYSYNTYTHEIDTNMIINCRFRYCGCGVYLGKRVEGCNISGSNFSNCKIGIFAIGGNNRISNNLFGHNDVAIDMTSTETTDNDGHSIFDGNVIIHNNYAIKGSTIENGSIFANCTIFYGDIDFTDAYAIMIQNCMINVENISSNSGGNRISNSVFMGTFKPSISGFVLNDCTMKNGTNAD